MKIKRIGLSLFLLFAGLAVLGQTGTIKGKLIVSEDSSLTSLITVQLEHTKYTTMSDSSGNFIFENIPFGTYKLIFSSLSTQKKTLKLQHASVETKVEPIALVVDVKQHKEIEVEGKRESFGVTRLRSIEGTAIYEGKKNEVIIMNDLNANMATNSTRQIYAKVPGINVWESDAAGIQLGIGVRGLDPNRTSNFNTRQNGYDMSADALGYPESYYVPPSEAVERIEVIRGAASLQYGPQFGGMLNYVLRKPIATKKIEFTNNNTVGSYGLFSTYNSLAGTIKKFSYTTFYQYKTGNGWRPNTSFDIHNAFAGIGYKLTEKIHLKLEYTLSRYLNQQPGGLTDAQFEKDPSVSLRSRNWFRSNWNILAFSVDYKINANNVLNFRNWGFLGTRDALGFLNNISRVDDLSKREMISDTYTNFGSEGRYLHKYALGNQRSAFLIGYRYYQGYTTKKQGLADNGTGPEFRYLNPDKLEGSSFGFPGKNLALFSENIFTLSSKLTITPGIRFEFVDTRSKGYFTRASILDTVQIQDERKLSRNFLLLGLGVSYYLHKNAEVYFNISQNYRGITFTDMYVISDAYKVDPNLKDERGFNMDLGMRGNVKKWFNYDVSVFLLEYLNRIGFVRERDSAYNIIRYTRNIGASRSMGVESFLEADVFQLAGKAEKLGNLVFYASVSYVNAFYVKSNLTYLEGNRMEFAPMWNIRPGINYRLRNFSTSLQFSYVTEQFTDAKNTVKDAATSVAGVVPAYYVCDWSMNYSFKRFKTSAGINNLTNNYYFTRRAASYPGPGIIPAEPRTFYVSLGIRI